MRLVRMNSNTYLQLKGRQFIDYYGIQLRRYFSTGARTITFLLDLIRTEISQASRDGFRHLKHHEAYAIEPRWCRISANVRL